MIQQNNRNSDTKNGSRPMESTYHQEINILPYAHDNDARSMDNFFAESLNSSLDLLSMQDHSMPGRERLNSFDSFASSSSAFRLVPRESRRIATMSKKKNYGVIMHPPMNGRPVVEFVIGDIPDHLLVPTL
jgi:hypothetical protein